MKDFSLVSLFAITHDMLGLWFWPAVIAGTLVALAFLVALIRQRGFRGAAARRAILIGVLGRSLRSPWRRSRPRQISPIFMARWTW
jgi:hypothetical protein